MPIITRNNKVVTANFSHFNENKNEKKEKKQKKFQEKKRSDNILDYQKLEEEVNFETDGLQSFLQILKNDNIEYESEQPDYLVFNKKNKNGTNRNKNVKFIIVDKEHLEEIRDTIDNQYNFHLKEEKENERKERIISELQYSIILNLAKLYLFKKGFSIEEIEEGKISKDDMSKAMKVCEEKLFKSKELYNIILINEKKVKTMLEEIKKSSADYFFYFRNINSKNEEYEDEF